MTTPVFNPPVSPSAGMSSRPEVKLLQADFGDGYTQHTRDGYNHIRDVLTLRWEVLTIAERDAILSFMKAQGGDKPFLYQPAYSAAPVKYTCPEWEVTAIGANLYSIDATFRQSFNHA